MSEHVHGDCWIVDKVTNIVGNLRIAAEKMGQGTTEQVQERRRQEDQERPVERVQTKRQVQIVAECYGRKNHRWNEMGPEVQSFVGWV